MARAKTRGPLLDRIVLAGLTDADGGDLRAGDSREAERFTDCDLSGRDLTGIGLQECELRGVSLSDTQLRGATLTDVLLSNCIIEELDLGGATVHRLELRDCRIGTLDVTRATLTDADLRSSDFSAIHGLEGLRGATIDDAQLSLLAPVLAEHLGIIVT